jgi:ABC-type sugar transport system substrate-binding protein
MTTKKKKKRMTRTIRVAIATAAVLALMSQAAQAQPITWRGGMAHTSPTITLVRKGTYMPVSPANNVAAAHSNHNPTVLTETVTGKTSVDWSAAAIGAGLAFSFVLIVIGAAALIIQHGRRRYPLSA